MHRSTVEHQSLANESSDHRTARYNYNIKLFVITIHDVFCRLGNMSDLQHHRIAEESNEEKAARYGY